MIRQTEGTQGAIRGIPVLCAERAYPDSPDDPIHVLHCCSQRSSAHWNPQPKEHVKKHQIDSFSYSFYCVILRSIWNWIFQLFCVSNADMSFRYTTLCKSFHLLTFCFQGVNYHLLSFKEVFNNSSPALTLITNHSSIKRTPNSKDDPVMCLRIIDNLATDFVTKTHFFFSNFFSWIYKK